MDAHRKRPCPDQRERLIAVAAGDVARDFALDAHIARCEGCRAWLSRVELHVAALRDLGSVQAPRDLEGRIVASTQAGFRQDRAVQALRDLEPVRMPVDVDKAIWPTGKSAPPVLDRLVDNDLQEQTRGIARRFAGRIERLKAPRTLDARMKSAWALKSAWVRARRRSDWRWLALAAALLLVVLSVTATLYVVGRSETGRGARGGGPQIVIERVASPADLDPVLQRAFALVVGGAPNAQEKPW
jgi:hypothetical protein